MMKILILYGGKSGEHEVSLLSAASVVRNLKESNSILLAGIDKDGVFYLQPREEVTRARASGEPLRILRDPGAILSVVPGRGIAHGGGILDLDVVFPVLHGSFGEDGLVQGLLETAMLPYVGSGVLASSLSMDKDKVKRIWKEAGLPVVPSITLRKEVFEESSTGLEAAVREAEDRLGYPLFVKPAGIGSSVGISKVRKRAEFSPALAAAFRYDMKVLVEKAVDAREIECSVLGNFRPRACTPGEVVPTHEFYDYDAKYLDPDGARLLIPAELDGGTLEAIKDLAVRAYEAAEAEGMARIDFFVEKSSGEIFLNEINTIPGFTNISMFPRMCGHDGLLYPELLESLLELGMRRFRERKKLAYSYQ